MYCWLRVSCFAFFCCVCALCCYIYVCVACVALVLFLFYFDLALCFVFTLLWWWLVGLMLGIRTPFFVLLHLGSHKNTSPVLFPPSPPSLPPPPQKSTTPVLLTWSLCAYLPLCSSSLSLNYLSLLMSCISPSFKSSLYLYCYSSSPSSCPP